MTLLNTPVLGLVVAALSASVGCAPAGGPSVTSPTAAAAPAPPTTTVATTPAAPTAIPAAAASPAARPGTAASPASTSSPEARVIVSSPPALSTGRDLGQTRVRFTVGDAEIVVRIADNPTSRDFVSLLPLTLSFRDFNAMDKIGDLPRGLTTQGSTSSAPANGDLIYFVPWGNLGLFYNAARRDVSFDDRVFPIGTIESGYERLNDLETGPVRAERIP